MAARRRDRSDAIRDRVTAHGEAPDGVDLVEHVAEHLEHGVGNGNDSVREARRLLGVEEPAAGGARLERELTVLHRVLVDVRPQHLERRRQRRRDRYGGGVVTHRLRR